MANQKDWGERSALTFHISIFNKLKLKRAAKTFASRLRGGQSASSFPQGL